MDEYLIMVTDWLGIPAALIAWGFALYVFVVAPPSRGARLLVAMLIVDGLAVITSYDNLHYVNSFLEVLSLPSVPLVLHQVSDWMLIAVYLPFLGIMLNTPLVAPLKNPLISRAIMVGGLAISFSILFLPKQIQDGFNIPFYLLICVVLTWGVAAAIHAWMIAPDGATRARARAFTIAFGVRDLLWTITFGTYAVYYFGLAGSGMQELENESSTMSLILPLSYQLAVILYVPLVAYGVLRVQLFDIDLRIKRTLKRSTVAAAFVATFFVISELASNYLSNQFGTIIGVLATGALVFLLDPIQRTAERISNAAMPNTVDTPEYEMFRKLQVYEAAVRSALEDGIISERQRRVLDSMLQSMNIDITNAQRIENDCIASSASGSMVLEN